MKKTYLFIMISIVLLFTACGNPKKEDNGSNQEGESTESIDQVLNLNISTEPPSLHPGTVTDTTSVSIINQIFEGLFRMNKDGELEMAMVEDYETTEDKLTYTFKLKDEIKWSNGDEVTSYDFEYAWKWVLDPDNANAPYAYQMYPIKGAQEAKEGTGDMTDVGITVIDEKTLEVVLNEPTPYILELFAFPTFFPINKDVAEKDVEWANDAGENYVTNGPFKLESWKHKSDIVLEKYEEYWDSDKVRLETINMFMIDDENTALNMFDKGDLDWIGQPLDKIPFAAIESMDEEGKLNKVTSAALYYYVINIEEEPFNNANIRKALALSINREAIVNNITKKGELPATAFVPPTLFEENTEGYFEDNNLELAKDYLSKGLDELGLKELPAFTLSYNTSESHGTIAEAIQDMWSRDLGVDVTLHNEEWGVYLDSLAEGNFQVGRYGWGADYMDAISFLEVYENIGGNNSTNWTNEDYQKLLNESRSELNEESRYQILRQAEEIIMDEMPIIPIYYEVLTWANNEKLKDVNVNTLALVQFKEAYFSKD